MSLVITKEDIGDPWAAMERVREFRKRSMQGRPTPSRVDEKKQTFVDAIKAAWRMPEPASEPAPVIEREGYTIYAMPIVGPCEPDNPAFPAYNGARDILNIASGYRITVPDCIKYICIKHNIARVDLISVRRTAAIVKPRMEAIYLARKYTPRSLSEISNLFGGRDHTTILHSYQKVCKLVERGEYVPPSVEEIGEMIGKAVSSEVERAK